jgi:hypothetical protein
MIFDGVNGYVKGSLNVPINTVLALQAGPVAMRNWYNTTINPSYWINISGGATGAVELQGTNDIVYASNDDSLVSVSKNLNLDPNATWTTIQAATSTSVTGTFDTSYYFLQLIVTTQGSGVIFNAGVYWN